MRSILVATDLTDVSDPLMRAAAHLAAAADAALHVIHAFDEQQLPEPQAGEAPTFQRRISQGQRALGQQIERTVPVGVRVATQELVIYVAGKAIVERALEVEADLVVIGPHRRRTLGDAYLGSTADHVVQHLSVPCLVVRSGLRLPLRRVIAPTDLSDAARPGLEAALRWAAAFGPDDAPAHVEVVHVLERLLETSAAPDEDAERMAALDARIAAAREAAAAPAELEVEAQLLEGESPADAIISLAQRREVDLLVLGTRGYGAIKRVLIGSVASSVARGAGCSVLLVPQEDQPAGE